MLSSSISLIAFLLVVPTSGLQLCNCWIFSKFDETKRSSFQYLHDFNYVICFVFSAKQLHVWLGFSSGGPCSNIIVSLFLFCNEFSLHQKKVFVMELVSTHKCLIKEYVHNNRLICHQHKGWHGSSTFIEIHPMTTKY